MIFRNDNLIPKQIIQWRLQNIDPEFEMLYQIVYDDNGAQHHVVIIESTANPDLIHNAIKDVVTPTEQANYNDWVSRRQQIKTEYTSTIDTLQQIEDTPSPTNAQVVSAVRFLAKTLKLLLKLLARAYAG